MNQYVITVIIVIIAAAVSAFITWAAVKLHSGGTDGEAVLEKVGAGITYAQSVASAITPFLPAVAGPVISKVLSVASKAVQHVEATYKAAISTDANATDTRQAEATSLIKSALALDGIADTAEVDKLIDVVIPLLVLALPKTHTAESGAVASDTTGAA
jgi:hypothetical protein